VKGLCRACGTHFRFDLIHNGFNDSSFAYCGMCGRTALCSHWKWPPSVPLAGYGPLQPEHTTHLRRCACGGYFHTHAMPRCPSCRSAFDPVEAASWIEAAAGSTGRGWRWQRTWQGLYAVSVGEPALTDPWVEAAGQ
jgi:hypothetical protein